MKKTFLLKLLSLILTLCATLTLFTACGDSSNRDDDDKTTTKCSHEYADEYTCHDRECLECGKVKQATTEHTFADNFTCHDRECECGYKEQATTEHAYVDTITAPTCTEKGYTTHTCECGSIIVDTYVDALGHEFISYVSDNNATFDADGTKTAVCERDGCEETDTITDENTKLESYIAFKTLTVNGNNVSGKVSNATETFSFVNEIEVVGNVSFVVALDEFGSNQVLTKIVPLSVGDNIFYVFEMKGSEIIEIYEINIRRRPIYTIEFLTLGSDIASQYVEEDNFATEPEVEPTRAGYTFDGWDYDFASTILNNTTIEAKWTANIDTKYTVEHYLQNIDNVNYTIDNSLTEELSGTTGTLATATPKEIAHFTHVESSTDSGNINGDGLTVLKVYYNRNKYTVTFDGNGGTLVSGNISQQVKYGGSAVEPTFKKTGYSATGYDKSFNNITEATTIKANWQINQYTLTIVYNNGQENKIITQDYNTPIETIETPERAGYVFDGWSQTIPSRMPAKNETIAARWSAIFNVSSGAITGLTYGRLTDIVIPEEIDGVKITTIGSSAFANRTSLTSIEIGDSVTSIGERAFSDCDSLTSIEIGGSVTSIGSYAFYYCYSLTSIEIPDSVTSIGDSAFYRCASLTSIEIGDSVTSIGDSAFYWCDSLTSIVIPDSVTSIGSSAFEDCFSLESIVIGGSVTSIGSSAFYECSSLTSIEIGDSVTSIGRSAFRGCDSLTYNIKDGLKYLGNNNNKYLYLAGVESNSITSATIDNNCRLIGNSAFYYCSSLTSIVIPDSVTSIGDYAFADCSSLTSIVIPDSVTSIGDEAFSDCYSLRSIEIGDSVTSIGDYAFADCSSLTSIEIGGSVTSIGSYAFYGCSSLTSITVDSNNTLYKSIDGNLYSKDGKTLIKYAIGKSAATFTIPDSVTSIGDEAFYECTSLTSIEIGDSVTSIGDEAFYRCSSLTSIEIGGSVTSIVRSAFYGCSSLTSIEIPDSVTSIGSYAFRACSSLTSIVIPDSVTSIGYYAFYNCSSLTIYCEAESKPSGWDSSWNPDHRRVVWGYKGN